MASSTTPLASYTGDFSLINCYLTTVDGLQHEIRYIMTEINVYEDLFNNQTTCSILVNDATNMIQNLPLFGFETLLLEFQTPNKTKFSKTFRLIRITDRKLTRDRTAGYIMHFVSTEAVTNLKVRVSKSYKGKLISDMVSDLHYNWLNGKTINIEPTQYQHHIVIPKIPPCQAINWLATRANSAIYNGANYLYYEDKNQFNFVSVESLMAQESVQHYIFHVANIRKDAVGSHPETLVSNEIAIQTHSFEHYSDILENIQAGMYANELYTHSNARKIWKDYTFDYLTSFDDYEHLYASNLLFDPKFSDNVPASKLKLHSTGYDKDGYPFLPELWLPCRISQLQQLQNIQVAITIPGDSERTVGQVIELRIPSPEPPINNEQIDDKYYSGYFLITALRHKIDTDKYAVIMNLNKDSTLVKYP